jgi:hypothetical protein
LTNETRDLAAKIQSILADEEVVQVWWNIRRQTENISIFSHIVYTFLSIRCHDCVENEAWTVLYIPSCWNIVSKE